ncbi:hypothetical protein PTMSG1_00948 [Pyrenophora teres f. maculata]|nr:hypothetical protein PTMSG1_00948 [Pyrenophora teres f. maculata]
MTLRMDLAILCRDLDELLYDLKMLRHDLELIQNNAEEKLNPTSTPRAFKYGSNGILKKAAVSKARRSNVAFKTLLHSVTKAYLDVARFRNAGVLKTQVEIPPARPLPAPTYAPSATTTSEHNLNYLDLATREHNLATLRTSSKTKQDNTKQDNNGEHDKAKDGSDEKSSQATSTPGDTTKKPTECLNSKTAATRPTQKALCRFGTHRTLNCSKDKVELKECCFHKTSKGKDKKDDACVCWCKPAQNK